jgi:predicted RNA-binding Zn ribbon-like protein
MRSGVPAPLIPLNSLLVESQRRDIGDLDRCGGDPALDFANTLGGLREGPWDDEWLRDYGDLARWGRHAGLVGDRDAVALLHRAAAHPRAAAAAHARAIALREQIHRVMAALAGGDAPPAADLDALRTAGRDALAHATLTARDGGGLDWTWEGDDLDRPLWPVAQAAIDLLRSERLARLKQCANCRWLFLDASRNASRRWCSMAHCGTGAKVAATRERRRVARR